VLLGYRNTIFNSSGDIIYFLNSGFSSREFSVFKGTNMLSINIPAYSKPSGYQLSDLAKPEIQDPKDVLIKVHAASINPIDVKKADGMLKFLQKDAYVLPVQMARR
jgi:hypothetical protein